MISRNAAARPATEVPSRNPRMKPTTSSRTIDHACLTMSARMRPLSGAQRAIGSDRSRSKTPLVMSVFKPDPTYIVTKNMFMHDDAGQRELQVLAGRAGDRAAEHVREQQHEHDRLDAEVAQLPRVVPDLDERAPGQRQRLPQPLDRGHARRCPAAGPAPAECCWCAARCRRRSCRHPFIVALVVGFFGRWPVRVRKTSSRLAPRRVSSSRMTPSSSSRRTTAGTSAGSLTAAVTRSPCTSGRPSPGPAPPTARSRRCSARRRSHDQRLRTDLRLELIRVTRSRSPCRGRSPRCRRRARRPRPGTAW